MLEGKGNNIGTYGEAKLNLQMIPQPHPGYKNNIDLMINLPNWSHSHTICRLALEWNFYCLIIF